MNKKILRWNFIFQYGYVLTNIFNSIILLPLYLKNIDSATLGVWLATGNILAWITLTDPGIGDVLQQKIGELSGKRKFAEIEMTIGSGFMASAIILVISIIAGLLFYLMVGTIINKNITLYPNLAPALLISIVSIGFTLLSFSISGINQGLLNAANVAVASLLSNIVFLVSNIVFLYLKLGIMSIAWANLCRAAFINIYNIVSLQKMLNRENLRANFDWIHFKKFIRIFSFTSVSRIITGLASSLDMIILARFIPPAMITVYEINKRPINMTRGLVGRHSVALMPLVSHSLGKDEGVTISSFISRQFRFYSYAAMFISFIFFVSYQDLISLWIGQTQYAGNLIMYLLVLNFFFGLIGYFMSNMGYALGDIKMNSIINMFRGVLLILLLYFAANKYGITGALAASLVVVILNDFFYFSYRLYKLHYLQPSFVKNILGKWLLIIPLFLLAAAGCKMLMQHLFYENQYLPKLILGSFLFSIFFLMLIMLTDGAVRIALKELRDRFVPGVFYRKKMITPLVKETDAKTPKQKVQCPN